MNRDTNRSERDRTPEARDDRSTYRDDDAGLYGFFPHRGPEAGPQHGNRQRDQYRGDTSDRRQHQPRQAAQQPDDQFNQQFDHPHPAWPRPSQGPPPESDRHFDTYESRPEPQSPYDEPDFRLNNRGEYDEPGYAVDEPYERDRERNQPQSGWGVGPRGQSRTHDGYGSASDNQPHARDDHDRYRPGPYATPPGRPGDTADEQSGRLFDQPHTGEPTNNTTRHARQDTDDRIRCELQERFDFDPFLRNAPIHVRVHDRRVTLEGEVDAHRDRDHAEDIAHAVPGTRTVHNHLDVHQRPR